MSQSKPEEGRRGQKSEASSAVGIGRTCRNCDPSQFITFP